MTTTASSLCDAALSYAARGWHVFPCHTPTQEGCSCRRKDCADIGKHPRTEHGFHDATTDETQIRTWWGTMWPQANIGIRTGAVSGLVVLDHDRYIDDGASLRTLEQSYHPLPETVLALTGGGGEQYFFTHPGSYVKNGVKTLGDGLDVRGDGGYVIAPPSLHKSGTQYLWEVSGDPEDTALALLPAWLLALCQDRTRQTTTDAGAPIPDGQRNETLFSLGCSFRAKGCTEAVILAALREMHSTQCTPPLTDGEVQTIAAHCATYEAGSLHADAQKRRNGDSPGPDPTDPFACPELPHAAKVDDERAKEASLFLDDYVAFSTRWAPRSYQGFHEAAALFALSTTAAHRVKIAFGPHGVFTSLYMALASRTSMFTKTTCVDIALALLRLAGMQALLADDDATPAAFLRSLTLHIPDDYGEMPLEAQEALRHRLAFAGQKGWFYEEWGQHLYAMMMKEGQMAAFRSILRRLDDHKDEYVYSTISRGRDVLMRPYVALLANVTPADLRPFLRAQSPLWRDGYVARFAFITPDNTDASIARFPEGDMQMSRPLVTTLASWHTRLGIPRVTLEPILDNKKKATGRYQPVFTQHHRETVYQLCPQVREAFYAYDEALHVLMKQSKNEDLDGSYARFPMKALRIAGLLASLHDESGSHTIWPRHWHRGQQIAERWRADLHKLIKQVSEGEPVSRESKAEARVLAVLRQRGDLTIRDINRWSKMAHSEILTCLQVLREAGVVTETTTARATKYHYVLDGDEHRDGDGHRG
jgi:hypothetical protein